LSGQCRIIAAAILGPNARTEFVFVTIPEMFPSLANGTVDLFIMGATHTMEREVYTDYANSNFSFSTPYLFEGLRVGGLPDVVPCADDNFRHLDECSGLKVCAAIGTTHSTLVQKYLPDDFVVLMDIDKDGPVDSGLARGLCNVIIDSGLRISKTYVQSRGYNGPFAVGNSIYSKAPLSSATRIDDPEFSDFVDSVIQALFLR
jgi:ABC-type amino acid transport substrate-binding protein